VEEIAKELPRMAIFVGTSGLPGEDRSSGGHLTSLLKLC
jgi:hypothetical protein